MGHGDSDMKLVNILTWTYMKVYNSGHKEPYENCRMHHYVPHWLLVWGFIEMGQEQSGANYFSTIALWAIQMEFSIARLKFKQLYIFVASWSKQYILEMRLLALMFSFGCSFYEKNSSATSVYVNLFRFLLQILKWPVRFFSIQF